MGEGESERHREEEVEGSREKKDTELMELSSAKPLKSSATQQLQRGWQAGRQRRERKNPKILTTKNHSLCCFSPCSLHTKFQSLCMVLKLDYEVANAFSAADKRSGFSSREKVCKDFFLGSHHLTTLKMSTRWETLICGESHASRLTWRVF